MNDLIGQQLGPYRILEQIGTGGMAVVYKAYQPAMDRTVAVKVISPHFAQDSTFRQRFRREARAVAKLEHAHILPVHDYGEAENRPYLVMRYLEAGTLKDHVIRGWLALDEVNRIIGQIGNALDYAHRQGVIHRDVKPTNVLLDDEGNSFLTDFGVAKMMGAASQLTGTGVGIGTPAYMSPEQGQGGKVDTRSDIYSLGVMLYEMAVGRVPYEAETPLAVVLKHVTEPLPLPRSVRPDLPESVERVILKALAKNPSDRFQTAGEMVWALDKAVRTSEPMPREEPSSETIQVTTEPRAAPRRPRWLFWAAGVVAIAIIAILAGLLLGGRGEQPETSGITVTPTSQPTATLTPIPTSAPTPTPGSPADQARSFAEPILAAIADRSPYYEEDFSDPQSGWSVGSDPEGNTFAYQDGGYAISVAQGNQSTGSSPDGPPGVSDFVLEVDAQFVSGQQGMWYVLFRTAPVPTNPHYGIGLMSNGNLEIWKNVGGQHIRLIDQTLSVPTFESWTSVNHLTLIAQDPWIAVYVNQEPLWMLYDESVSAGTVQLGVENIRQDAALAVQFDNLQIWDISDLPPSSAVATPSPTPAVECRILVEEEGDIYVQNCDGSGQQQLTNNPAEDWSPTWSPDGNRILFSSDRDAVGEHNAQLYLMEADSSNLTRLTHSDANDDSSSWSPDGDRIAFHSSCNLEVIDVDGANQANLVPRSDALCPNHPTWSPDGRRIAFRSVILSEEERFQIGVYIVNDDGSELSELVVFTSEDYSGGYIVWSPDGDQLCFDILLDGQHKLYAINSDGSGESEEVDAIPESWYPWHWPQWAE